MTTPRSFSLARSIESAPEHGPQKRAFHVADEYEALGDLQSAHELRRSLRGHSDDLLNFIRSSNPLDPRNAPTSAKDAVSPPAPKGNAPRENRPDGNITPQKRVGNAVPLKMRNA